MSKPQNAIKRISGLLLLYIGLASLFYCFWIFATNDKSIETLNDYNDLIAPIKSWGIISALCLLFSQMLLKKPHKNNEGPDSLAKTNNNDVSDHEIGKLGKIIQLFGWVIAIGAIIGIFTVDGIEPNEPLEDLIRKLLPYNIVGALAALLIFGPELFSRFKRKSDD